MCTSRQSQPSLMEVPGHWKTVADTWPLVLHSKSGWFNTNPFFLLEKNLNHSPTHVETICPWTKVWHSTCIHRLRLNISTVRPLSRHLASLGPPLTQQSRPCHWLINTAPTSKDTMSGGTGGTPHAQEHFIFLAYR